MCLNTTKSDHFKIENDTYLLHLVHLRRLAYLASSCRLAYLAYLGENIKITNEYDANLVKHMFKSVYRLIPPGGDGGPPAEVELMACNFFF